MVNEHRNWHAVQPVYERFSEEKYNFLKLLKTLDPESLLNPGKLGLE